VAEPTVSTNVFYVYILFDWRGLPFYVGKGKGRRWLNHECPCNLRTNAHRNNIIRKTLLLRGSVPKIKIAEHLLEATAHEIEKLFISALGRKPIGLLANKTDGGEGTTDKTGAIGRKISAKKKGHVVSQETRALLRSRNLGKRASTETRRAQSMAATGRIRSAEHNKKLGDAKRGIPRSEETKAKISAVKKGKKLTPEMIARSAAGHRGLKRSIETKEKMAAARHKWWAAHRQTMAPAAVQPELFASSEMVSPDAGAAVSAVLADCGTRSSRVG